ncbi:MAG: hypothetical protein FJ298_00580 [Planctomycetes bacterium]|nr:hypothetical protein [Planctomycetota bacterium]
MGRHADAVRPDDRDLRDLLLRPDSPRTRPAQEARGDADQDGQGRQGHDHRRHVRHDRGPLGQGSDARDRGRRAREVRAPVDSGSSKRAVVARLRQWLCRWSPTAASGARALGRRAEDFARAALEARGWRCLGQRVRTPQGELDLVLERGNVWICVEVKSGRWLAGDAGHRPGEHYSVRQAQRQERAAHALARQLGRSPPQRWLVELRFDAHSRCRSERWTRVDVALRGFGRASGRASGRALDRGRWRAPWRGA